MSPYEKSPNHLVTGTATNASYCHPIPSDLHLNSQPILPFSLLELLLSDRVEEHIVEGTRKVSLTCNGNGHYQLPTSNRPAFRNHRTQEFSGSNYVVVYENRTQLTSKLSQADVGGGKN